MSFYLRESGFDPNRIVDNGNRYLLGNGHIGYRGTLEEFRAEQLTGLNLVGVYDQRGDTWRESLNLPNPFYFAVAYGGKEETLLSSSPLSHEQTLDIRNATFERKTEYPHFTLSCLRFVESAKDLDGLLGERIVITAKTAGCYCLTYGFDSEIYDIHGPHFVESSYRNDRQTVLFKGKTNEGKTLYERALFRFNSQNIQGDENGACQDKIVLQAGETLVLEILSYVGESLEETEKLFTAMRLGFDECLKRHEAAFAPRFDFSRVQILADEETQFALDYSLYHLLILADPNRCRSIAARGLSGQTYKGAVFWDTEIFLLPFFSLTDPQTARALCLYRVATLEGAKAKAKEFGYEGAFYAWESQDTGLEACSKYNVEDPVTHEKIRTYFNEKQIHISADIPYAFERYLLATGDETLLRDGGFDVLLQCALFFVSYAQLGADGKYHLNDVIGPDEYHERVDDNAFTNYMARKALQIALSYAGKYAKPEQAKDIARIKEFLPKLYLPLPNEQGVIEQFKGYFQLEKTTVETVRSRLRNPKDYWGGEHGVATPTQVIKQADVVAMLALLSDEFPYRVLVANFDYYFPLTEHGSSLSASMYSLLGVLVNSKDYAYEKFVESAKIDLVGAKKLFAGGIYIGGTHPASEGGAYLAAVYGFAGLHFSNGSLVFDPRFPRQIGGLTFHYYDHGVAKTARVSAEGATIE